MLQGYPSLPHLATKDIGVSFQVPHSSWCDRCIDFGDAGGYTNPKILQPVSMRGVEDRRNLPHAVTVHCTFPVSEDVAADLGNKLLFFPTNAPCESIPKRVPDGGIEVDPHLVVNIALQHWPHTTLYMWFE
jgi:hypothetical protein